MIGTRFNPAYAFEQSPAGEMGPRGCEPLVWTRPSRIARSQPYWFPPKTARFQIGTTPVQICAANPNRGNLNFFGHYSTGPGGNGLMYFATNPTDLLASPPQAYFGQIVGQNGEAIVNLGFSYQQSGALCNLAWWAVVDAFVAAGATVDTTEMDYFG